MVGGTAEMQYLIGEVSTSDGIFQNHIYEVYVM